MAESIHEQIAAAIAASLAGIVGDDGTTYWYTPTVVRTLWFEDEGPMSILQDEIGGPIYAVRPGDETHAEGDPGRVDAVMDVFVLVAAPYNEPDTPFAPAVAPAAPRWTVINRMVRDVLRKLFVDVQLLSAGGAVSNIFGSPVLVDRDRYVQGWAIAEIQFSVTYRYLGGVP